MRDLNRTIARRINAYARALSERPASKVIYHIDDDGIAHARGGYAYNLSMGRTNADRVALGYTLEDVRAVAQEVARLRGWKGGAGRERYCTLEHAENLLGEAIGSPRRLSLGLDAAARKRKSRAKRLEKYPHLCIACALRRARAEHKTCFDCHWTRTIRQQNQAARKAYFKEFPEDAEPLDELEAEGV
jgi:hypothetical protein